MSSSVSDRLVYVGLTIVDPDYQTAGIGLTLWKNLLNDCASDAQQGDQVWFFWFHTANYYVARAWWKLISDVSPALDGTVQTIHESIAAELILANGWSSQVSDVSRFLLRSCTKARYKPHLVKGHKELPNTLFSNWQIDERKGDRLLFIGPIRKV
jgi:hypothetical protein